MRRGTLAQGDTVTGVSKRPRLRELDLLRFLAAALVVSYHYTGVISGPWPHGSRATFPEVAPVGRFGHLGVELFFLISGFVILMSAWGRRPGDFAVSRFARLFPAYWFSVLLTVVVFYTAGTFFANGAGPESVPRRLLPNLTMFQDGVGAPRMEGLYWTLWIELHFYVLVALLIWRGVTYGRCVGFMIGWLLITLFAQEADFQPLKVMVLPGQAPYFIAGMAFFLIYRYRANIVLWLIVAACWALSSYYMLRHLSEFDVWPGVHEYVIPATISAFYLVMTLVATHRLAWLRWRGLTVLGALTYPLYLTHETVVRPVVKYLSPDLNRWAVLGIAAGGALALAYIVHRLVETPGQRLLRARLKRALADIRAGGVPAPRLTADSEPTDSEPTGPEAAGPRESSLTGPAAP